MASLHKPVNTAVPIMCLLIAYVLSASEAESALPRANTSIRLLLADASQASEGSPAAPGPSQPSSKPAFSCPRDANFTSDQDGYGQVDTTADEATVCPLIDHTVYYTVQSPLTICSTSTTYENVV